MKNKNTRRGFTLIELLVVILIIGILAAIALPQYQKAVDKARTTELLSLIKHIKDMQEIFYLTNGSYATNCEDLGLETPNGYSLNNSKLLINSQKFFTLDCQRASLSQANAGHDRVAGIYQPDSKNLISFEMGFSYSATEGARNKIWCIAAGNRLQKVCNSFCGTNNAAGTSCYLR